MSGTVTSPRERSTGPRMKGKIGVVTGGASGIGEATCLALAEEGAAVVVADLKDSAGLQVADRIVAAGGQAAFVPVDVSNDLSCKKMVAFAKSRFGGLDCAVNCAAIAQMPMPMEEIDEGVWRRVWEVDTLGIAFCMKHQVVAMVERGGGAIVNIASGAGLRGAARMAAYASAKFGVVGISRSAAIELAPRNIRVNTICPGLILTPLIAAGRTPGFDWSSDPTTRNPMGRIGQPYEVADAALWLVSDRSSFVTGISLSVDGGLFAGALP
jgi:NAD(P)-dependent dehydrogenase (short-subunit alcohol dehydrogenase family)